MCVIVVILIQFHVSNGQLWTILREPRFHVGIYTSHFRHSINPVWASFKVATKTFHVIQGPLNTFRLVACLLQKIPTALHVLLDYDCTHVFMLLQLQVIPVSPCILSFFCPSFLPFFAVGLFSTYLVRRACLRHKMTKQRTFTHTLMPFHHFTISCFKHAHAVFILGNKSKRWYPGQSKTGWCSGHGRCIYTNDICSI